MTNTRPQSKEEVLAMRRGQIRRFWAGAGKRFLPFADAASADLPLARLMRLSLFQVSVGMALVLLNATLNRVMIVEIGAPAGLVSALIALPLLFAPVRVLIGHRSDQHRSFLGWRRVPYLWMGTMMQFGGLSIMPFALLLLTGDGALEHSYEIGLVGAGAAFLLVGAGMHTAQTAGLALASDLAPEDKRPRVVALLYVMLLIGMVASAEILGRLLGDFSNTKLVQVIQGTAVVTIVLNLIALWKQEARQPHLTRHDRTRIPFADAWAQFTRGGRTGRLLAATGLGAAAFSMQDILLEPYGGEVLGLTVSETTRLTALLAGGTLAGFAIAARALSKGGDAYLMAALGGVLGLAAFPMVILSDALQSVLLFRVGTGMIGLGAGLFSVGTLIAAMSLTDKTQDGQASGLALGAWGAVQASAMGLGIALGGALRDVVRTLTIDGAWGEALARPSMGYLFVYHVEILLLFATLAVIGPMVRHGTTGDDGKSSKFGLADLPG